MTKSHANSMARNLERLRYDTHGTRKSRNAGMTLIELMIVIAIMSIIMGWAFKSQIYGLRLAESEAQLQIAIRSLQNEVEILRASPWEALEQRRTMPFDKKVRDLEQLVAGRGEVRIERDPDNPGLLLIRVEVHWRDPGKGMRSAHTILMKSPDRKAGA